MDLHFWLFWVEDWQPIINWSDNELSFPFKKNSYSFQIQTNPDPSLAWKLPEMHVHSWVMARSIGRSGKKKANCERNEHRIWRRAKKSCFDFTAIHDRLEPEESECSERGNRRLDISWLHIPGWLHLPNEMICACSINLSFTQIIS